MCNNSKKLELNRVFGQSGAKVKRAKNKFPSKWCACCSSATSNPVKANRSNLEVACEEREQEKDREPCIAQRERELSFAHSECSMCFNLTFHFALALSKLLFMNHFPACRSLPANTGGPAAYGSTHKRAHVSKCHSAADRWMQGEWEKAKEKSRTISQKKWFKKKQKTEIVTSLTKIKLHECKVGGKKPKKHSNRPVF